MKRTLMVVGICLMALLGGCGQSSSGQDSGADSSGKRGKSLTLLEYVGLKTDAARADRVPWKDVQQTARKRLAEDPAGGDRYDAMGRVYFIYNQEHDVYVLAFADRQDRNFQPQDWKSMYVVVVDAQSGKVRLSGPCTR